MARKCTNNGAQGRNRTTDTAIFSRMLYQLSYLGTAVPACMTPGGAKAGCLPQRQAGIKTRRGRVPPHA